MGSLMVLFAAAANRPDYSQVLNRIAAALSRPGVSPWILAAFSAMLGIVGGAIGRALEPLVADIYKRRIMRKVIYTDLDWQYAFARGIAEYRRGQSDRSNELAWMHERLRTSMPTDATDYIREHRETFIQLTERVSIVMIYRLVHDLGESQLTEMDERAQTVVLAVNDYVRRGTLPEKYLRRYMHNERFKQFHSDQFESKDSFVY